MHSIQNLWDLTNGPLSKLLAIELLDTQVCSGSVKSGSEPWRFHGCMVYLRIHGWFIYGKLKVNIYIYHTLSVWDGDHGP